MKKKTKLHTFEVKVVGYESVQAESADAALEAFEEMLQDGYTMQNLRWKSYTATATNWEEPVPSKPPKRPAPPSKPKHLRDRRALLFTSSRERGLFLRNAFKLDPADIIICALANAHGDITKTALLSFADAAFWEGYASSRYVYYTKRLRAAFDELLSCGSITWEPRQPVRLVEEA